MLHRVHLVGLLFALSHIFALTSAWPWPPSIENIEGLIVRRADTKTAAASETAKPTATAKASKTAAKGSATGKGSTITSAPDSSTGAAKTKGSETKGTSGASKTDEKASKTKEKPSKTPAVDPRLPAGGVEMLTPAATALTTYYKVGDYVTFGWNYTSLSVKPSHIDVYVTCTANSATYTISNNASFHSTGHAVWDTKADATGKAPLLTDQYTLVIHDADKDVTAVASAGYLGTYDQFVFGMYTPQPYTPLSKWKCAVCSGALSDMERQTLKFMFGMCIVTVLSFTWFVGGTGLLFRL